MVWNQDIREVGKRVPVARAMEVKPVLVVIDGKIAHHDRTAIRVERA